MFKVLVLQKFHGLRDDATEEQIFDRASFKNFLGLCIGDSIPDAKTLWDFNRRIRQGERPEEFDANPVMGRQKDSEARWTKKNNAVHYGWKNHVKADLKTKLILRATTMSASVHDSQMFEELLDEKDRAVLADRAYHTKRTRCS